MARVITFISILCYLTTCIQSLPTSTTASWSGWSNVKYLFAFGDSYTSTGFSLSGAQPSPSNPMGNPAYPGSTSSDGPNYIDYLTVSYNQSFIQTYNFGYGGATIDPTLVPNPYGSIVQSFQQQVQNEFLPNYGSGGKVPWTSANSLFTIFFGINDINLSYQQHNTTLNDLIIQSYTKYVGLLYNAGARNFLIMNVPPIDRSPGTASSGSSNVQAEGSDIGDFNLRLQWAANSLATTYKDATFFQFDTNWLFTVALNHPDSSSQTAGIKNTTQSCDAYQNGTPTMTYYDPSCGVPVNQYFWLGTIHPTWLIHDLMAVRIVQLIG